MRLRPVIVTLAILLLLVRSGDLDAQQSNSEKPQADTASPTSIYIPYTKLKDVFEKQGRGVFLPYEQFEQLWQAAERQRHPSDTTQPPTEALISMAINQATVTGDVVRVESSLTIELLKQGWLRIPLRLNGAALLQATIADQPARVIASTAGGYDLLVQHDSQQAEQIELKLVYAAGYEKSPGLNRVSFQPPQAPVHQWRVVVPQKDIKVSVHPTLAATEQSSAPDNPVQESGQPADERPPRPDSRAGDQPATVDTTEVSAFVGSAPQVIIEWTPRNEGAAGLTPLVSAQTSIECFLVEGLLNTRARISYEITRAPLDKLAIEIPSEQKVINLFDPNIKRWEATTSGDVTRIDVELFEPAAGRQDVVLELERPWDANSAVRLPVIKVADAGRQQGSVLVNVDASLRADMVARSGLVQIDQAELPAALTGQNWTFAYRYASVPFSLELQVSKLQPRIEAYQLVTAVLEPNRLDLTVRAILDIQQAGIFQFDYLVPDGFTLSEVRGVALADAQPASVESHQKDATNPQLVHIELSRRALGRVGVTLQLKRALADANLATPTGQSSNLSFRVPLPQHEGIHRIQGSLLLHAPSSLRLSPVTLSGMRSVSHAEALTGWLDASIPVPNEALQSLAPSAEATMAFVYSDQVADFAFTAERRKSNVTARERLAVRIEPGVIHFDSLIFIDIVYSGIQSIRVDVPASISGLVRSVQDNLRDSIMSPQPDDVPENYIAWSFEGDTELIGSRQIQLTWDLQLESLDAGKSQKIEIPRLQIPNVDRVWGQIMIAKSESLDFSTADTPSGVRPIDPVHDVMPQAAVPDAARAFEHYGPWQLALDVTRYELEEVKRTAIERGLLRAVVTRNNQVRMQVSYRIQSARQRLAIELPAEAEFDAQPARINGNAVQLERGVDNQLFVPLTGQDPTKPFELELRYIVTGSGHAIAAPTFPEDPAVQKIYLAVYLPKESVLVHSSGPWTQEFASNNSYRWHSESDKSDEQLVAWLREGIQVSATAFPTDGVRYLFSSLSPPPPPEGNLRLWTFSETSLSAILFIGLLLVGLLLLRVPVNQKLVGAALLAIVLIACGLFLPALGSQLWDTPLIAAMVTVGLLWFGRYLWLGSEAIRSWHAASAARPVAGLAAPTAAPQIEKTLTLDPDQTGNGGQHE